MTIESRNRPYSPPSNVIDLLQRLRTRNLPEVVNSEYLAATGLSSALGSRLLNTLRFLNLIRESGEPEDVLRSLARSTDDEYKQVLEGVIRDAYRDIFDVIDPSQDSQDAIVNAFRRFEPASQHYRMASLFLGLCREAGIPILEEPRRRKVQRSTRRLQGTGGTPRGSLTSVKGKRHDEIGAAPALASPVLLGYFQRLPKPGSVFPSDEQQMWLDGISVAFRLEYQSEAESEVEEVEP